MMRRKLFFLLDKLQINRSERIAISALLILLTATAGYYSFQKPEANFDAGYYEKLEQVFEERSRANRSANEAILARYQPITELEGSRVVFAEAEQDSVTSDTTKREAEAESILININTANSEQLQELPGIGPAYARNIIEWREQHGTFTSIEQLLEIRGIGERRLEVMKPFITL